MHTSKKNQGKLPQAGKSGAGPKVQGRKFFHYIEENSGKHAISEFCPTIEKNQGKLPFRVLLPTKKKIQVKMSF